MVLSADELLQLCWGDTPYGDNPLHKTIAQIRGVLGDNAKRPLFIETIRMRGYRTVAEVRYPQALAPAQTWIDQSPFRGLQAFDAAHAEVFFGRSGAIAQCVASIQAGVAAGNAMTLLLGASGSGKSSLMEAGVLPLLQHGTDALRVASATTFDLAEASDHGLLTVLASALLDWQLDQHSVFPDASSATLGERLRHDLPALLGELGAALDRTAAPAQSCRLAVFIDRFEVLFASARITDDARAQLLAVLDNFARSRRIVVILACRNDFYPRIVQCQELMECKAHGGHVDLRPPVRSDIAQMIRGPAAAAQLRFGVDASGVSLDDALCDSAAGNPDILPLLQYTLQELYRLRSADGELGFAALHQLGGVDGAIGQRAEEVVSALTEGQRAALPRVLSLLVALADSGEAVVSGRSPWSSLRGAAEHELVSALVESRLFVAELVGDEPGFGVAHEALLRRWPRVTQWIDTHRSALQVRKRISVLAARWDDEGRSDDLLLPRGRQLDEAQALAHSGMFELSAAEAKLIEKSRRKARWRERRATTAIVLIAGLAIAAATLGFSEAAAKRIAQVRRAEAEGLMEFMLGEFATKLRPLARLDLLDSVSAKAMEYLSGSQSDELTPASLTHRAKALQVIGEVRIARGDATAAVDALGAARHILEAQLDARRPQRGVLTELGVNAFWLGQLYLNQGDWPQAELFFKAYRDYSDRVHQLDPDDVDAWIEQSYAHSSLGALANKRGDMRGAAAEFLQSISLKTRALQRKPGDRPLTADLANSLSWQGSAQESLGDLTQAAALYERELALVDSLHQAMPGEALWTSRYANALLHRAGVALVRGDDAAALADYRRALQLYQPLLREQPDNRDWLANQISASLQQYRIMTRGGQSRPVLAALQPLAEHIGALVREDPHSARWIKLEAAAAQTAAAALLELGQAPQAGAALARALPRLLQLQAKNAADVDTRKVLAHAYLVQADVERARGDAGSARQACLLAHDLLQRDAPDSTDFRLLDPWVQAGHCLGQGATVNAAKKRLADMGYRQTAYVNYLNHHPSGE